MLVLFAVFATEVNVRRRRGVMVVMLPVTVVVTVAVTGAVTGGVTLTVGL
ncbi:MAG: hypothetical protein WBC44_00890 [Planctomycetaceae bacterium]